MLCLSDALRREKRQRYAVAQALQRTGAAHSHRSWARLRLDAMEAS